MDKEIRPAVDKVVDGIGMHKKTVLIEMLTVRR